MISANSMIEKFLLATPVDDPVGCGATQIGLIRSNFGSSPHVRYPRQSHQSYSLGCSSQTRKFELELRVFLFKESGLKSRYVLCLIV